MRLNLTEDRRAALRARVGWLLDLLHELLGERYHEFRRREAAAADFELLPRDCRDAALKAEAGKKPVPFVEAAKNLVRAVVEADDGERRTEPLESLARRVRSWEKFKRAARQWCERHGERRTRKP
jgi:hypothetical protein